VAGGLLVDGFVLKEKITIVYVIEDCEKSGKIAANLHGNKLDVEGKQVFELEVVHSVYTRIDAVPKQGIPILQEVPLRRSPTNELVASQQPSESCAMVYSKEQDSTVP
jgi:hypothetical protein